MGAGGTGSLVADSLCRLLIGLESIPLFIIDPDRVEPHNLRRQSFYAGDVGKFKSQVIAERCARQYGRKIGYSVFPYDKDMLEGGSDESSFRTPLIQQCLIIGCVDNAAARRSIAESVNFMNWWIDAGNGYESGQVLIGNVTDPSALRGAFHETQQFTEGLPMPSLQLPALLMPAKKEFKQRDCAEAVADNDQSAVINQAMATLVLNMVHRIIKGDLNYMASYLDLAAGTLRTVPADPVSIARMFAMKEEELLAKPEKIKNQIRVRV